MKKEIVRREFLKWKIKGLSYAVCKRKIKEEFEEGFSILTLKRWWKRFNKTKWDLKDKSTRPKNIHYKFSKVERKEAVSIRKKTTYSAKQIRIKLQEKGIIMSESYIKTLVKDEGLSRGNKMEGIKLKWVRFERDNPTTVGKLSAIQQTIFRELPNWNNDLELWRYQYNHERPHQSLHLLTPAKVYFQFKRH